MSRLVAVTATVIAACLAISTSSSLRTFTAHAAGATEQQRPELAYLAVVNRWRPPADPAMVFLLMGQFANAGQYEQGIAYFGELRQRFDSQIDDAGKAMYLDAIAALRADMRTKYR